MKDKINIIYSIIQTLKYENDFSIIQFENIKNISITEMEELGYLGKVTPSEINNQLVFDVIIHKIIIENLLSDNDDKIEYATSIIKHELFHIKEMVITNRKIPIMPIFNIVRNSTYSMLIHLGYIQWSEYYAHYNSYKYYQEQFSINKQIEQAEISLTILKDTIIKEHSAQLYEFMYNNIESFIARAIIISAHYNYEHDKKCLTHLIRYRNSKLYKPFYDYIYELIPYMESLYNTYPNWVDESHFFDIGKHLFSIIHAFGITFSTDDLSDNFVFKLL